MVTLNNVYAVDIDKLINWMKENESVKIQKNLLLLCKEWNMIFIGFVLENIKKVHQINGALSPKI